LNVPALLEGLRAAGFAPVAEGPDGRVLLSRPEVHRASVRPASSGGPGQAAARASEMIRDTVRLVRRGDDNARAAKAALGFVADPLVRSAPMVLGA
jgi:hypothetical protein